MHTLETFQTRTHTRGTAMPRETVGVAAARELVARVDEARMHDLAVAARDYLPAVLAELETLAAAHGNNPAALVTRAVLFGIATPNRDERDSIDWAIEASAHYGLNPAQLARVTYRGGRSMGLLGTISRAIAGLYERCRDAGLADLVPAILETIHGIGPKVARMITAVANPAARVWTVDLWHTRQLLWAAGLEYRVRPTVTAAAYATLEARWLDYYERYFADVPTWAAQWATWNAADGRHNSHSDLWADLAA